MLFLGIISSIKEAWTSLLMSICESIYKMMCYLYELFEIVGTADILNNDTINKIYTRVGFLLGLYMLFKITFSFVQMLINPDLVSDKEKGVGNLVKKAVLVVALLGFMPTIFNKAMDIQNMIVGVNSGNNIIAKLILPQRDANDYKKFGSTLSAYTFTSFYKYDERATQKTCAILKPYDGSEELEDANGIEKRTILFNSILKNNGSIAAAYACLEDHTFTLPNGTDGVPNQTGGKPIEFPQITFARDGIFAVVIGGFICWTLLMYIISVGVRVVQLAFLRMISPLAIMTYLSPKKDTTFEKWGKMCITTYVDLFIRMAIIYFITYVISLLMTGDNGLTLAKETSNGWIVKIVMIIALLSFAKRAPELLKELFPKGGAASLGFGFGAKDRIPDSAKRLAGFGLGAAVGGAAGFLGGRGAGRISGLFGGLGRGAIGGAKKGSLVSNMKGIGSKQAQVNKRKIDWQSNGVGFSDRMKQRANNFFGRPGEAERYDEQIVEYDKKLNQLNTKNIAYKDVSDSVGKMESRATDQLDNKTFKPNQIYQRQLQERRRNYRALSQAMSNGDVASAKQLAMSEQTRVNTQLADLASRGITSGEEYERVNAEWTRINDIGSSITGNTYTSAQASSDMIDVLTETRNNYITESLRDTNGDVVVKNEATHIQDVVNHPDNQSSFAGFTNSSNGTSYAEFDSFSGEAKTASSGLASELYRTQTAKEVLSKSEAKQKADATRNAVGGHQGGNK